MADFAIRRGLDIPIAGAASGAVEQLTAPARVGIDPREFRGLTARLAAREGDAVKRGTPLFRHKNYPEVVFVSPAAGTVAEIKRGERRVLEGIFVTPSASDEAEQHRAWTPAELATITDTDARRQLLAGGLWPALRTRPFDRIAGPETQPQWILISAFETGPVQPGADALLTAEDAAAMQAGVHVLRAISGGRLHLATGGKAHPALDALQGVERHTFSGPHPAGDPAVQINYISPPKGAGQVWYVRAWDVALIGRLFLEGTYPAERRYAVTGAGAIRPRVVSTIQGATLGHLVGETRPGANRWIVGSVLTGAAASPDAPAGFLTRGVHVLPEEVDQELLGWAMPGFGRWSAQRLFPAAFSSGKTYDIRPGVWGGERAIVPVGFYEKVVATPEIEPTFLFRSLFAGDTEDAVRLGMLDLSLEEAALCTYVCPAKLEFDVLLRNSLDAYAKEIG